MIASTPGHRARRFDVEPDDAAGADRALHQHRMHRAGGEFGGVARGRGDLQPTVDAIDALSDDCMAAPPSG